MTAYFEGALVSGGTKFAQTPDGADSTIKWPHAVIGYLNDSSNPVEISSSNRLPVVTRAAAIAATTGNITANAQTVSADVSSAPVVSLHVKGTFSGLNMDFEGSIDGGTTWVTMQMSRSNTTLFETSSGVLGAAPAYVWRCSVNGFTHFRVRATAFTSGTANIVILPGAYASEPSPSVGVTGGSLGTVSTVTTVSTLTSMTNWGNIADNAAFTDGTTRLSMSGYIFDETAGTALTENDAAAARVDSKRAQVLVIEDATTRGQRMAVGTDGAAKVSTPPLVMSTVTITHPANTTTYTAGDAYADSGPTANGFEFTGLAKAAGKGGIITGLTVINSHNPGTPLQAELWLFDTTVTAITDNAAFSLSDADAAKFITKIPFVLFVEAANNSIGSVPNLQIPYTCVGSTSLRGLVRTVNGYVPASSETLQFKLYAELRD